METKKKAYLYLVSRNGNPKKLFFTQRPADGERLVYKIPVFEVYERYSSTIEQLMRVEFSPLTVIDGRPYLLDLSPVEPQFHMIEWEINAIVSPIYAGNESDVAMICHVDEIDFQEYKEMMDDPRFKVKIGKK